MNKDNFTLSQTTSICDPEQFCSFHYNLWLFKYIETNLDVSSVACKTLRRKDVWNFLKICEFCWIPAFFVGFQRFLTIYRRFILTNKEEMQISWTIFSFKENISKIFWGCLLLPVWNAIVNMEWMKYNNISSECSCQHGVKMAILRRV